MKAYLFTFLLWLACMAGFAQTSINPLDVRVGRRLTIPLYSDTNAANTGGAARAGSIILTYMGGDRKWMRNYDNTAWVTGIPATGGADSSLFFTNYRADTMRTRINVDLAAQKVNSITLNTPAVVYSTPVTFNNTSGAWDGTLSFANQSGYTIFRRGSGTGTPSFGGIDSNYFGGGFANTVRPLVSLTFTTTGTSGAATGSYNNSTGVFNINVPQYTASGWSLSGNTTSSPSNYLGTLNSTSVRIGVNNTDELTVSSSAVIIPTNSVSIGSTSTATNLSLASSGGAGNGIELNVPTGSTYGSVDFRNNGTLNGQFASTSTTFSNGAYGSNSILLTSLNNNGELILGASGTSGRIVLMSGGIATTNRRMIIESGGAIGINTNAVTSSSILDIASTDKGVLFPRQTTSQRNAIASPASGLQVYDSDSNRIMNYTGSAWKGVRYTDEGSGTSSILTGSDVTIVNADTWYDAVSITLPAGTWDLNAQMSFTGGAVVAARIYNGTAAVSSGDFQTPNITNRNAAIHLTAQVTISGSTTYTLQGASSTGASTARIKYQTAYLSQPGATQIRATKVN